MCEKFIFDVPIYRTAKASYIEDQNSYIEERLYDDPEHHAEIEAFYRECPEAKTRNINSYWRQYGGPWRFNDIIGYIRLYLNGYEVRGELWYVHVKRIVRKPRHKLLLCTNTRFGMPVGIPTKSSNDEIFNLIMKYLDSVRPLPKFKNRFIDSSLLETVGPYVDWKLLINEV